MLKDIVKSLEIDGVMYPVAFTLNVMEAIQEKYGSLSEWTEIIEPEEGEPPFKDIKWIFAEIINEGIDIENERKSESRKFLTTKQVGRIISSLGIDNASATMAGLMSESTSTGESEGKNE